MVVGLVRIRDTSADTFEEIPDTSSQILVTAGPITLTSSLVMSDISVLSVPSIVVFEDTAVTISSRAEVIAVDNPFDMPLSSLLNPGKAVPTLTRCAEIGGMHVHAGEIPFPDIERF
jgi:hypothetical protein